MSTPIPRPGDYIVVRTGGLAARLIRAVTRSRFNHAAIYIGGGQLIEATPRQGVRIAELAEYAGDPMLSNSAEPTLSGERDSVVEFARAQIGERYNWDADLEDGLDCLGLRWRLLSRLPSGRRTVMCSQLVAAAGAQAGLNTWLCGKPNPGAVTPADLATRIEKGQWK